MTRSAGIRAVATAFPETVRTNDYYRQRQPDVVAHAEQKTLAKLWSEKAERTPGTAIFDEEMKPYLDDPFRGTVERRMLLPGETSLSLQVRAARAALDAARLAPEDIDLALVTTFYPEHHDVGNAPFVARDLGLRGAAWNLESACSSSVVGLQNACALVAAGEAERVLVVVCCRYSHVLDESDTLAWFLGDGAGALVVAEVPAGEGYLGGKTLHSGDTCGVFYTELVAEDGTPGLRMRAQGRAGQVLRETSATYLRACCEGAAARAKVSLAQIDFFIFNTPTAWFATFAARALEVSPDRTISCYPRTANVGPALMPANLSAAARAGRIAPGDLVMIYAVGSVSSASAVVVRWGDVALGPDEFGDAPIR